MLDVQVDVKDSPSPLQKKRDRAHAQDSTEPKNKGPI